MWVIKPIWWFILIVIFGTLAHSAEAAVRPPTPLRVAHELGYRLAIDPRVMPKVQDVTCWWPATDRYDMECASYFRKVAKAFWTEASWTYGVKIRRYEDGSWAIRKYRLIYAESQIGFKIPPPT